MPRKDDIPRIRDHDVPEVEDREIPLIRDHDFPARPSGGLPPRPRKSAGQRSGEGKQPSRSRRLVIALGMIAALGVLAFAIALFTGRTGQRQPIASNPAQPSVTAPSGKERSLYDLARPQFLEYHVWIWVDQHGDQSWTDRVDAVIREIAGASHEIPDLEVIIRLPRQFGLSHVISPGETVECSEPTYSAWRHAVPGLVSALMKSGVSEQIIRGPVFSDCSQGTPSPEKMSDDRLYRIEIWLKSPALH